MNRSETLIKIAPALLEAQKAIGAAKKGAENPFFHSKYADLGAIMEACKEPLNNHGVTVLQPVGTDELGVYVETILLHDSGEFISDKMRIAVKTTNSAQDQGSAISYARRYSLQSMMFIPAEDDDAETTMNRNGKATPAPRVEDDGYTYEPAEEAAKPKPVKPEGKELACEACGEPAIERKGTTKAGKPYHGIFCSTEERSHTKWMWN